MLTGDVDLDSALARAPSRHGPLLPEDRATEPVYPVEFNGAWVARAWRPDASTALYLLTHPMRGGRH